MVSVRERSRTVTRILEALAQARAPRRARLARGQREAFSARVKALPTRADLTMPINEKLVVELYSK